MIKKIGLVLIGIVFIGVYAGICINLFTDSSKEAYYVQNELMFGSDSLLGGFIFMTLILLIVCNYLIDLFYKKGKNKNYA